MKSEKKEHEHVYRRTIDESGEYHACECGYISRTPTIPEDSIHPPQSSNPDPAGRLKELAKKIRSYEESDKTVLNILEDFLDEHAGESAWEDAEKALNAHYLTIAERLIGEDENNTGLMTYYPGIEQATRDSQTRDMFRAELRTAFRKVVMSNTKQQNPPDPVEMLYIESPSISLKQFREAIDRLVTEARIDELSRLIGSAVSGDKYRTKAKYGFLTTDERIAELQSQLTNKEEK